MKQFVHISSIKELKSTASIGLCQCDFGTKCYAVVQRLGMLGNLCANGQERVGFLSEKRLQYLQIRNGSIHKREDFMEADGVRDIRIDDGRAFDWGRTSEDYAKYRDIYPDLFYEKILAQGLCVKGQNVLDLGTGTGVLPRNLAAFGAAFTAVDPASNQILHARRLAKEAGVSIRFDVASAETIDYPPKTFDTVTACQCFFYFRHEISMPRIASVLKPGGRFAIFYMAWLPDEDPIARESENMVLRYNPSWSGAGETVHPIWVPDCAWEYFVDTYSEEYRLDVRFTRESWHGRIRSCRGIGASLSPDEIDQWDREHKALLENQAPEEFRIRHYAAMRILTKREGQ